MHTNPHPLRARLLGLALACLTAFASVLSAQSPATGSIQGRVQDVTKGNYLNNARVSVAGTGLTALTNSFGEYRIDGVPAGIAQVTAFYSGLTAVTVTVEVGANGTVTQNIELQSATDDIIKLDAMTVTSSREMSQASIATNEQRFAPNMKTVLSADEFGEQSENNVAEFLKLMPGVQISYVEQDARNASLRGMPAHATIVTANGNQLASAASGSASRVFEFEQISINEIARVEINKSLMPDMPAEGIGGTINLITKSAFERSRPEFRSRAYFNFNTTAMDLKETPGPFNEDTYKLKPGFDFTYINPLTKNFGITVSGSHSVKYNPQWFADPTWTANPDASQGWTNPYMSRVNIYDGPKSTQRTSARISVDWRFAPNDTLSIGFSEQFYRALIGNRRFVVQPGSSPTTVTPEYVQGRPGASNTLMNNSFNDKSGTTWTPEFKYFHNGPVWKIEAGGAYSHAGNDYMAEEKGFFSGVNMTLRQPNAAGALVTPAVRLDYTGDFLPQITAVKADGTIVDPRDMANYSLDSVQALDRKSYDIKKTLRLNAERHFDVVIPLRVKFGGDIRQAVRDIRETTPSWNFVGPDLKTGTADNMAGLYDIFDSDYSSITPIMGQSGFRWFDAFKVYDLFRSNPGWFQGNEANLHNNLVNTSKNIVETVTSGYVRLDTALFRNRLLLSGGVRFQEYKTKTESGEVNEMGKYLLDDAGDIVIDPATGKPVLIPGIDPLANAQNTNIERGIKRSTNLPGYYPSVNAIYLIKENLQFRASFAKSINYPQLSEILAVQTVSDPGSTSTKRLTTNLPLDPWTAKNYDIGLEYYTRDGGAISLSFWKKEMTGFITTATYRDEAANEKLRRDGLEALIPFGYEVREKFNAGYAEMDGWEFALNQKLDPIVPDWARGITVFFNTSYKAAHRGDGASGIDAESKRSYNWGGTYHRGRFATTLKFNHVPDPRPLVYSATATHDMSRTYTDADVTFRLTRRLSLFASGTNIFAVPTETYVIPPDSPDYSHRRAHRHFGVQVVAGIKGNF